LTPSSDTDVVQSIPKSTFLREALLSTLDRSCRPFHEREHCLRHHSPSGGSGMTHASHSSPIGNHAQNLQVTQMSCNQYQNRLSCGRVAIDDRQKLPSIPRERTLFEGELTLRGLWDDACVPFESDGKSSLRPSRDADVVQSMLKSTFLHEALLSTS